MSLVTKAITMSLGMAQVVLVVRLLSRAEYGLVGLVMSIGSLIGVSQHLGIVDGAIREIAVRHKPAEIGKVFWVSNLARQVVTLPLSLLLVGLAGLIAERLYQRPEIINWLQLYAAVLVLQGFQDVLGATLTGLKRFRELYAIQIVTAVINVVVFGYLTWRVGVVGFFWAVIITTLIMVLLLGVFVWRQLRGYLRWPSWAEIQHYGRDVMRIGAFMYLSRILFVVWQRLPILVLGGVLAAEELGSLNVAQAFGSKLTIIAAALSEVNLAWMSSLFATRQDEFRQVVQRNMQRVLLMMTGLTLVLLFFTPEILRYVIGAEYLPAERMILVTTVAFFLYALLDIGTSSLFVSADQSRLRAGTYGLMSAVTMLLMGGVYWWRPEPLWATVAVLAGGLAAYVTMVVVAQRRFAVQLLTPQLLVFLLALGGSVLWLLAEPGRGARLLLFGLLAGYILWESHRQKLLPSFSKHKRNGDLKIICFAGAAYNLPAWTNRQHMMWRISQRYPVLYVEPRVWIVRSLRRISFWRNWLWFGRAARQLYLKAQWNLIPGSREVKAIAWFNHYLNRWWLKIWAGWLGFNGERLVLWLYDTEAAEYLSAWPQATVVYDCVDDHGAQAGVDRNPRRVREEEKAILRRARLVFTTSQHLFEQKRFAHNNVHLLLNAGDVPAFLKVETTAPVLAAVPKPVIGTVGALDGYKIDFELLLNLAQRRPDWHFVLVGEPALDRDNQLLVRLAERSNVHLLGAVDHRRVPQYVYGFDVCMIPYRSNAYNAASFPLKFWEFMATGKPVVVAGVPELKAYRPLVKYVETADEFEQAVAEALRRGDNGAAKRRDLAQAHTWEMRAAKALTMLEQVTKV